MATAEAPVIPQSGAKGIGSLDQHVLDAPERGAGIYFPAFPLGISLQLGALGIVLGLLSCANAKLFDPAASGAVVPVALSVGAVAITAGGIINFRAGVMVAGVIGVLYGVFWLSLGLMLQFFAPTLTEAAGGAAFGDALGTYLLIWAVVSAYLALATVYVGKVVCAQQTLLVAVFVVLGLGYISAPGGAGLSELGGWLGIVDALLALYISAALVVNETAGKTVVPLS